MCGAIHQPFLVSSSPLFSLLPRVDLPQMLGGPVELSGSVCPFCDRRFAGRASCTWMLGDDNAVVQEADGK